MYLPAFLLGLLGSLHCAVMCAPIMLSVPWRGTASLQVLFSKVAYQTGRIGTYVGIGLVLYWGGRRLLLGDFQQSIGIVVGIVLLLFAVFNQQRAGVLNRWVMKLYRLITKPFGALVSSRTLFSRVVLGAFNGLLPCGLVYVAAFTSVTMQTGTQVAMYMLCFGVGTLPLIASIIMGAAWGKKYFKFSFNRAKPFAMALMGLYFIVRSLELGIPYLSPVLEVTGVDGISNCAP